MFKNHISGSVIFWAYFFMKERFAALQKFIQCHVTLFKANQFSTKWYCNFFSKTQTFLCMRFHKTCRHSSWNAQKKKVWCAGDLKKGKSWLVCATQNNLNTQQPIPRKANITTCLRRNFIQMSKVIPYCIGIAFLRSVIGPENLHLAINPSEPITKQSPALFPRCRQFGCFTFKGTFLSSDWQSWIHLIGFWFYNT